MKWPGGEELNETTHRQISNFRASYRLYVILFSSYHESPPKDVDKEYWKNKVVSAFNGQVYFNLPNNPVLYTGLISRKSLESNDRTDEHRYPRKEWAQWRLFDIENPVTFEKFFSLYCEEGGSYNITTNKENRALPGWYKKQPKEAIRDGGKAAYKACGIILVEDPDFTKS